MISPELFSQDEKAAADASSGTNEAGELAKKLSNPVSSMISVPFQSNIHFGVGENKGMKYTLNFQPVVPVALSKKVNLISRLILPVINQYHMTGYGEVQGGLGDAALTFFFSPVETKNGLTWGGGPVFNLPTSTIVALKTKKFGLGPSVVILKQIGGITTGTLLNQLWSIAGSGPQDISNLFFQYFFSYNWNSGAGVGANLEGNRNWKSKTTPIWINASFSAVSSLGNQKMQWQIGPKFSIAGPASSRGHWGVRTTLTLVFPK